LSINELPKVGGLFDLSPEVIKVLSPTIVFLDPAQEEIANFLSSLDINSHVINCNSINNILNSIIDIGKICNKENNAFKLKNRLIKKIRFYQKISEKLKPLRGIVFVGSLDSSGDLRNLFISGNDGYFTSMLEAVNILNVSKGTTKTFASISKEGLIAINPDVIIHILSPKDNIVAATEGWKVHKDLNAVKLGNILINNDEVSSLPGPRFLLLLKKIWDFRKRIKV
jgi:iron complex transport system substrate-binding protein